MVQSSHTVPLGADPPPLSTLGKASTYIISSSMMMPPNWLRSWTSCFPIGPYNGWSSQLLTSYLPLWWCLPIGGDLGPAAFLLVQCRSPAAQLQHHHSEQRKNNIKWLKIKFSSDNSCLWWPHDLAKWEHNLHDAVWVLRNERAKLSFFAFTTPKPSLRIKHINVLLSSKGLSKLMDVC